MTEDVNAPYPESTDRVEVTVYCLKTGAVRQVVKASLADAHRQHAAHPGHGYLETTGQRVQPHEHAIDLKTLSVVPRTRPNPLDVALKGLELRDAARLAAQAPDDLTDVMLRASLGDADAQTTARNLLAAREAARTKLEGLLAAVAKAETRAEIEAIKW